MAVIQPVSGSGTNTYSDLALILGEREARQYNMSIGDWTEMRVCVFWGIVNANTLLPTDGAFSEAYSNQRDYFWFGLKETNSSFPSDTNFVGIRFRPTSNDGGAYCTFNQQWITGNSSSLYTSDPSVYPDIAGAYNINSYGVAGPAIPHAIRYVIQNKGQSNQTIRTYCMTSGDTIIAPADAGKYTSIQIQNVLSSTFWTETATRYRDINWNSGSVALPIPESLFIYCPLSNHRLALHGVGVKVIE